MRRLLPLLLSLSALLAACATQAEAPAPEEEKLFWGGEEEPKALGESCGWNSECNRVDPAWTCLAGTCQYKSSPEDNGDCDPDGIWSPFSAFTFGDSEDCEEGFCWTDASGGAFCDR